MALRLVIAEKPSVAQTIAAALVRYVSVLYVTIAF